MNIFRMCRCAGKVKSLGRLLDRTVFRRRMFLIVSQALTLFTTPVVYLYLDRLQHWLSGAGAKKKRAEKTAPLHPAPSPEPAWVPQTEQPAE